MSCTQIKPIQNGIEFKKSVPVITVPEVVVVFLLITWALPIGVDLIG